ncbi:hypothetical protein BTZ20_5386 [Rhodococcus sp. MTM3W5.2]|uniref:peroxidase-related enzyme n=1 Tax=Rhodococcus sp. MTM3W5.2 TaxID=1805827 RepID=UPI0009791990|nr:peroxidase-related enzyme [Rhodococcus sp. MTM3W5.2]AQA25563.1 hypothetical protein BTZ20_5386 [Rhodococcus sp. MTM3W5.2]
MSEVREVEQHRRPSDFTQDHLDWVPWLEPIRLEDASEEQRTQLVGFRGESPYFRLLARDPQVLGERSANDKEIFYGRGGLSRTERELAATATSRLNGCVYCTSVHARFTSELSKRHADVQKIMDEGVTARVDDRWDAVVDFAAALAAQPPRADSGHLARLRAAGFTDEEIGDLVLAAASFSWANRLMLSLGEPEVPVPAA